MAKTNYTATREQLADAILKNGRPFLMQMNHDGTAINILHARKVLTQGILQDILDYVWATGFDACRIEMELAKH